MNNTGDNALWIIIILIGVLIGFGLLVELALYIEKFSKELKFVNMEIRRNDGEERQYWISQRRQLWLSMIPFVWYR